MIITDNQELIEERMKLYEKQLNDNYEKWKNSSLMQDVPEKHAKKVAMIFENQSLYNQKYLKEKYEWLTEYSMEIAKKVFANSLIFDIVNVKPMLGPVTFAFHKNPISIDEFEIKQNTITAKTRKIQNLFSSKCNIIKGLIEDENYLNELANNIKNDIFNGIITDLMNNVGTVGNCIYDENYPYQIYNDISKFSELILKKTIYGGLSCVIGGKSISKKIQEKHLHDKKINIDEIKEPTCIGTMSNTWKIIVVPQYPPNEILLTAKPEENVADSYFYCPYIPISISERTEDVVTRYGKRLSPNGSKFFAKIKYRKA